MNDHTRVLFPSMASYGQLQAISSDVIMDTSRRGENLSFDKNNCRIQRLHAFLHAHTWRWGGANIFLAPSQHGGGMRQYFTREIPEKTMSHHLPHDSYLISPTSTLWGHLNLSLYEGGHKSILNHTSMN